MMKKKMLKTSLFAMALTLGGAAAARAGTPDWCKASGADKLDGESWEYAHLDKTDDPGDVLYTLVNLTCPERDENAPHAVEIKAARDRLSKQLGLVDADWADAAAWAVRPQVERNAPSPHVDEQKAWSSYDAIDQYMAIAQTRDDHEYLVDALGAKLTATGRLAYVQACLGANHEQPVRWAICAPDLAALDGKAVLAELHADTKHTGYERTMIRLQLDKLSRQRTEHAAAVKELLAKDEAYGKLFDIAAAARKDWDAKAPARQPLLDAALAMDDARVTRSRKALAGCTDKTWPAWQAAVAAIPAKRYEHLRGDRGVIYFVEQAAGVIVGDPDGYLASLALFGCESDRADRLVYSLGQAMQRWPGFRGPRTAALVAILGAGLELDTRGETLEMPGVYREWIRAQAPSSTSGGEGAIASVKAAGDKVHVTFAKKLEKQVQCTNWKRTNRVTQIRGDGTLVYEQLCLGTTTVTVDRASDPQDVDARYAKNLKPGMIVQIVHGIVEGAWAKDSSTVPSLVAGVPVK